MTLSSKVAVNPLPWILGPDTWDMSPATVTAAVAGIARSGFTAMHADIPEGMSVATKWRSRLRSLRSSPPGTGDDNATFGASLRGFFRTWRR